MEAVQLFKKLLTFTGLEMQLPVKTADSAAGHILNQSIPVHTLAQHFFKNHLNIIVSSTHSGTR
jgi:hypothetical protein